MMTPNDLIRLECERHCGSMPPKLANGFVIAYFADEVLVGRWQDEEACFIKPCAWETLMEIHIFNEQEEFRALFSRDYSFPGSAETAHWLTRYVSDDEKQTDGAFVYDEKMLIIGNGPGQSATKEEEKCGFATRGEAGRRIVLPTEACGKRLWVRNYLRFDPIDEQANMAEALPPLNAMRIADYRFVGFAAYDAASKGGKEHA